MARSFLKMAVRRTDPGDWHEQTTDVDRRESGGMWLNVWQCYRDRRRPAVADDFLVRRWRRDSVADFVLTGSLREGFAGLH